MKHRRDRPIKKQAEPVKSAKAARWLTVVIVIVLAGVPFGLGKYCELSLAGPYDSGAYVYSAKHILDGARMGVEEVTSAQPATLLVNMLGVRLFGFNDVGPKIIQMVFQLIALTLMFYTVRRLFGNIASVLSVVVASVYLSAPVIAKYGNVKEQFMIAFMIVAACGVMLRYSKGSRFWLLIAGAALINTFYFKATGLSVVAAIALFLLAQPVLRYVTWRRFVFDVSTLWIGAVIGIVPLVIFHIQQGRFNSFRTTVPVAGLKLVAMAMITAAAVYWLVVAFRRYSIIQKLRSVRPVFWVIGVVAFLCMIIPWMVYFNREGELRYFVKDLFFIAWPQRVFRMFRSVIGRIIAIADISGGYVGQSRAATSFKRQSVWVLGYYKVMVLPIALAAGSILLRLVRFIRKAAGNLKDVTTQDRFALLLATWWILDMAFVWVSRRPYEQYYLPLTVSAAMLAGYGVWLYAERLKASTRKIGWLVIGMVAVVAMLTMSWPVFVGLEKSPWSGMAYTNKTGEPELRRGYAQKLRQIADRKNGRLPTPAWEVIGEYIKNNSTENDRIYVWGWYPGIYVKAQRLSAYSKAYESNMHVISPGAFRKMIRWRMLRAFKKHEPKFIVDTLKIHFPNDRPPLPLWLKLPGKEGFLPAGNKAVIAASDKQYADFLESKFGKDEALRYEEMAPLREYVMDNYRVMEAGQHVLFERK